MMEDLLERSILQRRSVHVPRNPVIVEDWCVEGIVEHVIGSAGDTGVLQTGLVDQLEDVIDAGKNVVHEDHGVEIFSFVAEFMKWEHGRVAHLREVFNTMIESTAGTRAGSDSDSETD